MSKLMLDILNRPINEGDIVVVKGNGGQYSSQKSMEIGIRVGDTIKTLTCSRNPSDKFLVKNPTEEEEKIKAEILNQIASKKLKAAKKAAESSKLKANKVGTIYKVSRYNEVFVYVGKAKVEAYYDGVLGCEETGNLYISLGCRKNKSDFDSIDMKKLIEFIGKTSLSTFSTDRISSQCDFVKTNKVYSEIYGEVTDFTQDFEINFDCMARINGVAPYEKGCLKIKKA